MNFPVRHGVDAGLARDPLPKTASILLLGTSFKSSPIGFREGVAARLLRKGALKILLGVTGVLESSVIETCNRIELYLVTTDPEKTAESVLLELGSNSASNFYRKVGLDAVCHMFAVASGLDSLVIGEDQILGQVRDAGRRARVSGDAKSVLSSLFDAAYNVGRRTRGSGGASQPRGSVGELALKYGLSQLGRRPKRALLIGTGETARLASLELKDAEVYLLSRRRDSAARFPRAKRISRMQLKATAGKCDLIIAATRHDGYVLKKGDVPDDRRRVLLDLGFPRNIDPSLKSSSLLRLYDLDDLAAHAEPLMGREDLAEREKFILAEAERFDRQLMASRLTRTLPGIYKWAENIRDEETGLALRRLSSLSERDKRVVEAMSRRLVSKLMAPHAAFVKQQGGELSQKDRLRLLESVFWREGGD